MAARTHEVIDSVPAAVRVEGADVICTLVSVIITHRSLPGM